MIIQSLFIFTLTFRSVKDVVNLISEGLIYLPINSYLLEVIIDYASALVTYGKIARKFLP